MVDGIGLVTFEQMCVSLSGADWYSSISELQIATFVQLTLYTGCTKSFVHAQTSTSPALRICMCFSFSSLSSNIGNSEHNS
jgi:hypothetical protein